MEDLCRRLHKRLLERFKHALVWGASAKHIPQVLVRLRKSMRHALFRADAGKHPVRTCPGRPDGMLRVCVYAGTEGTH